MKDEADRLPAFRPAQKRLNKPEEFPQAEGST
jgi:hypothetical protein